MQTKSDRVGQTETKPLFQCGQMVMTRGVNDLMAEDLDFTKFCLDSLRRHQRSDWGELDADDKASNDSALKNGDGRLFSAYTHPTLPKIWIITEWDRSVTTVLFPDEY